MTTRTLLCAPVSFYCDTAKGNISYDGLSPTPNGDGSGPLPQPQDCFDRIYQKYDLAGYSADVYCADGQVFDHVYLTGSFVGQRGANVTLHGGSTLGASKIAPAGNGAGKYGNYPVGLAWGACLNLKNCWLDAAAQVQNGGWGQDVINVGQGARLLLIGDNYLVQEVIGGLNAFSFIDIELQSSVEVFPDPTTNKATLTFAGAAFDGIQVDEASVFQAECNGIHGIISFISGDTPTHPTGCYFFDAFADVMTSSKINIAGVDFKNPAYGCRYRVREGGTLFVNEAGDPNQLGSIMGSSTTSWPVDGRII